MKKITILMFLISLFNLLMSADNPKTEIIYPHYRYEEYSDMTEQFEIPVKLTYTISLNKRVYMPDDEVYVDMVFEYITSSPRYMPNDKIEVFIPTNDWEKSSHFEEFQVFPLGETSAILNDNNKTFKTRTKVVFSKKKRNSVVVWYNLTVTGKNIYGPTLDNNRSEDDKNYLFRQKSKYTYTLYPLLDKSETPNDKDLDDEDNLQYKIQLNK